MMAGLKSYWSGLAAREQRLLQFGGPAILVLLVYLLVWEPLQERRLAGDHLQQQEVRLLGQLESLRGQLQPVKALDQRQWQALAQSHGWHQVGVEEQAGRWLLQGQAAEPRQVEAFLQAAADQGWHWDTVHLEGRQPLKIRVGLRPL